MDTTHLFMDLISSYVIYIVGIEICLIIIHVCNVFFKKLLTDSIFTELKSGCDFFLTKYCKL